MDHADKVTHFVVNNISHHIIHQVLQTSASEARNAASQGVEIDIRN
jgi:RNase adaptor protein for sRNA GlmZ degradation